MSSPQLAMSAGSFDRIAESLRTATMEHVHRATATADELGGNPVAVTSSESLRVGVDLVTVSDVAASVERLGLRYLYRVFTPHERACARLGGLGKSASATEPVEPERVDGMWAAYSMQSLASRFAAKEAVVKVLRPSGARPEWKSIEVHRARGGWCELRLTGLAARLAGEAGITTLAVSLTHEPAIAAACVVAMRGGHATAWHRNRPLNGKEASHG